MPSNAKIIGHKKTIGALDKFAKKLSPNVIKEITKIVHDIRTTALKGIQKTPRQNRTYISPTTGKKQRPGKIQYPPAVDSGNMVRSIIVDARKDAIEVGSTQTKPPYPLYLEEGTRYHKPWHPWLKPAVDIESPNIEKRILKAITNSI